MRNILKLVGKTGGILTLEVILLSIGFSSFLPFTVIASTKKLWLDFKAQYCVDPRNFVSALSQHLIEVEENTNVEILEVVQELLGMVEKKEQPVVVAVKKE